MQRISLAVLISLSLLGCGRRTATKAQAPEVEKPAAPAVAVAPLPQIEVKQPEGKTDTPQEVQKPAAVEATQEKYDAAFQSALGLLGQGKYEPALQALQSAQAIQDNEFIRGEIARLKLRIDQEDAARKTLESIEAVLAQGKAKEGADLADAALKQFGGTDSAERIIKAKLQAEALIASEQKGADAAARFLELRTQAEAALKENNLRAASLAFEFALQAKEDAALRKRLDELRETLNRYDAMRQKAAELRNEPGKLDEALGLLQQAAKAWDTPQIRQEIDEYTLALRNQRDRVSVADFEVRGEVGIPQAGRTIAEELLPHLKTKFDVVERAQVAKVINELKLEGELGDNPGIQADVGKLAKVRYLVLGSVSPLGGITASARLVDVQTGLVVQTGKVSAPTREALMPLLADLAKQLLMTDEEKLAFEAQQVVVAKKPPQFAEDAPLPPPPAVPAANDPFAAPVVFQAAPPLPGPLQFEDFDRLPAIPAAGAVLLPPGPGGAVELRVKQRLLHTVLYIGDDYFRRGRYHEAHRHFEIALQLAPGHFDIRLRLDRCRPLLPPPVVIVQPVPVIVIRPRVAILPFVVRGNPLLVPPSLSTWTPNHLAAYLRPTYDIVDPLELYWYMGSMNLTMGDLLHDPWARRWLGRVLNVRYFVFGDVRQTASFDVNTFMVDAEHGFLAGRGHVHVHSPHELKLRLSELAYETRNPPIQRAVLIAERQRIDALLVQAHRHHQAREFALAINIYNAALRLRPGSVEILFHLNQSRHLADQLAFEEARRRDFLAAQVAIAERQRQELALAQAAEAARIRGAQQAALLVEEQRRIQAEQRRQAHLRLATQARFAFKAGNFAGSIRFFESALNFGDVGPAPLVPRDELIRELAQAKAEAARANEAAAAAQLAAQQAEARRKRDVELILVRKQAEELQKQQLAKEEVARKAEKDREQAAYQKAFDQGQVLLNKGDLDGAIAALQSARQIRRTEAVEALLNQAFVAQAQRQAQAKGETERLALEKKLAEEKSLREKAEAAAKRNRDLYAGALKLAQKALAAKQFDEATTRFQEAGKLFRTDEVLTGLKSAEEGKRSALAEADVAKKRSEKHKLLLDSGRAALTAKRLEEAVKHFSDADALNPQDLAGKQLLIQAQTALEDARRAANLAAKEKTTKDQADKIGQLLANVRASIKAGNLEAASQALAQVSKFAPKDAGVLSVQQELDDARRAAALASKQATEKEQAEKVRQLVLSTQAALKSGNLDAAAKALAEASKLAPKDAGVVGAQQALDTARKTESAKQAEQKQFDDSVKAAQTALLGKKFDEAAKLLSDALKLRPNDPQVRQLLSQADKLRADAKATQEAALKKMDFDRLMKLGSAAMATKKFAEAKAHFTDALKTIPNDPTATRLLQEATQALLPPPPPKEDLKRVEFDRLMKLGTAAMATKKFAEAKAHFTDALKAVPNDPTATRLLQEVNQALLPPPPPKVDLKKAEFDRLMKLGTVAMATKKFAEAKAHFTDALKAMPNDPTATRLLQEATQALTPPPPPKEDPKKPAPPPAKEDPKKPAPPKEDPKKPAPAKDDPKKPAPPTFQKEMADAAKFEGQGKFAEAAESYKAAVKLADPKSAPGVQKKVDFTTRLAEGQKHLQAMRWPDAEREFQSALQVFPGNPVATQLLQRAKLKKN